jgi:hypothetical protein
VAGHRHHLSGTLTSSKCIIRNERNIRKHRLKRHRVQTKDRDDRRTWKSVGFRPFGKDIMVMDRAMADTTRR